MRKMIAVSLLLMGAVACAGGMSQTEAKAQVQQLMTLYKENPAKFVVQKQEIIQSESCDWATALRTAIDEMAKQAAMSPEDTTPITMVQMELQQAERACLAK